MDGTHHILVVDDQEPIRRGLTRFFSQAGHSVEAVPTAEAALESALASVPDLVIVDLDLPGKDGLELIADLQERGLDTTFVILTGNGTIESAIQATRRGVFDYVLKPPELDRFRVVVDKALERSTLRREVAQLRREMMRTGRLHGMVGRSRPMQELYRMLEQVAPTSASVLITGESGTGKEVIARSLHRMSPRASRPFVAINCAAIPETLLESEIFGHEKGAFTGATAARTGCFEQADGGTLFLDEIAEMSVDLQSKLLRVIEDQRVRRVGSDRETGVDVRVLAATNTDVHRLMREGDFREDLYFRLNVFTFLAPPLRERPEDIPLLLEHFLHEFAETGETRVTGFSESAIRRLRAHDWPGNVRELRNVVQRATILCREGDVGIEHLPPDLGSPRPREEPDASCSIVVPLGSSIEDAEKALILRTLEMCEGKKAPAAEILGISLKTLYTRLHAYEEAERDGS